MNQTQQTTNFQTVEKEKRTKPPFRRFPRRRRSPLHALLLIVTALIMSTAGGTMLAPPAARPALALGTPVVVNTTAITKDIGGSDGKCDLWEALQAIFQANYDMSPTYNECTASPGANTIVFAGAAAGGVIEIPLPKNLPGYPSDLPQVWGDTTIQGPVTINGGGTASDLHLFNLKNGATLTLIGVTIADAHTTGSGAAILDMAGGTANLVGSSLIGNTADAGGGAISSVGNVNITLSNFSGNTALGLNAGTGIGGAIDFEGTGSLKISQTNFAGNIAKNSGGAISLNLSGNGQASIEDSVFSGNIANGGTAGNGGGAIFDNSSSTSARLNIARTALNANLSPGGDGGAIYNGINATTSIVDTSFNGNVVGTPTQAQMGGAIYNQSPSLAISRSAFLANSSISGNGGGLVIDHAGVASVVNTTFYGNNAPAGNGGGVLVTNTQQGGAASRLTAKNVTFSTNAAKPPSDHGGGIFVDKDQAAQLGNTIVDGSISGNCVGTVNSLGHNLDSGSGCNFNQTGDIQNGSAKLDSPGLNGGPISSVLSEKLLSDSAAIDAGDDAICAAWPVNNEDERGKSRPKDGDGNGVASCDIGAFESDTIKAGFGSSPVQPGPIDVGNVTIGQTGSTTFNVFSTGDKTLTLSGPAIGGTNPSEFGVLTAFPVNVSTGGSQDITVKCSPTATGGRSVTLTFNTNDPAFPVVVYNLTCNGQAAPTPGFGSVPIAPGPIVFPSTVVGKSSSATFLIQETGSATLQVNSATVNGLNGSDFAVSTVFPISIADGGGNRTVSLTCTPSAVGVRTAKLILDTNDPHKISGVSFDLVCTGVLAPSPYLVNGVSTDNSPDKGLDGVTGVVVSPDNKNVYSSSYLAGSASSFSRDIPTGALGFIARDTALFGQLGGAHLIAMSPDGKNAYVAASTYGTVIQLNRDPLTGDLAAVHGYTRAELAGTYGVALSPDGRFVYVTGTGSTSGSVVVFARNTSTGSTLGDLTYVDTTTSTALLNARGLTVSPDGTNLYVTAFADTTHGNLVVYKRDVNSGKLTLAQTRSDGDCIDSPFPCFIPLNGLKAAYQVAVSPDNANVYAVGYASDAVVAFQRRADGTLRWIGSQFDGSWGVDGLNGASGIAVTPDGSRVLVSGYVDKAVAVFNRDLATGSLTFAQMVQRDGTSGIPPLDGALDLAISPDGKDVYVAAFNDDSIAHLRVANPVPTLASLNPSSAQAGSPDLTLTVDGADFLADSVVVFKGLDVATTYVNSHQLKAAVPAASLASAGSVSVKVRNSSPGGGYSNVVNFTVTSPGQNPVPSIDHISPAGAMAGSAPLWVDIYGANFTAASSGVEWNGQMGLAAFVDSTHLQYKVSANQLAQPGQASVDVLTVAPGGGRSNAVVFDIAAPGKNPVPSITSISPSAVASVGAASSGFTLVVNGLNFTEDSVVKWNGKNRPTKFVSSTQLQATIEGADIAFPGSSGISVATPGPGGGESNVVTFTVLKSFKLYVPIIMVRQGQ